MPHHSKWQYLPTEAINTATLGIDTMPALDDRRSMLSARTARCVAAVHSASASASPTASKSSSARSRKAAAMFLVGAGTSGRLGILEAAEMPPTFGTPPKLVQAIMAGGQDAVFSAREGVEDNYEEGARSDRAPARRRSAMW